jgi:glycosyltransferase involved in cell wall biosynthesis
MNVLIFGFSPLPIENPQKLFARNFRTWQITKGVLKDNHNVLLICYNIDSISQREVGNLNYDKLLYYSFNGENFWESQKIIELVKKFVPDCIIGVSAYPAYRASFIKINKPFWVDLFGAQMAEAQTKTFIDKDNISINYFFNIERKLLMDGDIFSTLSNPHKYAVIGELALIKRLNKSTFGYDFVKVLPVGITDYKIINENNVTRNSYGIDNDDFLILNNGTYNNLDVKSFFKSLELAMKAKHRIKFISANVKKKGYNNDSYNIFKEYVTKSKFKENFIFLDWVGYSEMIQLYKISNLGIVLDMPSYQTMLCIKFRIFEMIQYGLPFIISQGIEINKVLKEQDLCYVAEYKDFNQIKDIILHLYNNKNYLENMKNKLLNFAGEELNYYKTTKELREWIRKPEFAPDRK